MLPRRATFLTRAGALLATLCLAALLSASPQQPGEQKFAQPGVKQPVPDPSVQGKAEITITHLYATQLKAAKSDKAAARELAQELLTEAKATRDDYKLRFVGLKLASELGASAGDTALALEAIGELSSSFQIDTISWKADIYAQAVHNLTNKNDASALTEAVLNHIDEALAVDNFKAAVKLLDTAQKAMLKGEKIAYVAQAERRGNDILEAKKAHAAIQPFLAKVGKDDQATLAVARYYCFINGNYDKGLPLLYKCTDKTLRELAERDLAGAKDAYSRALLADEWNEMSLNEKGLVQRQMLRRANHWYQLALPGLEGLTRVRVQREVNALSKHFAVVATVSLPPVLSAEITTEVRTIAGVQVSARNALSFSQDGKWILCSNGAGFGGNGTASLWDIGTGQKVKDLVVQNNAAVTSGAISADKKFALTGGNDNSMILWNLQTGQQVRQYAGHNGAVSGVFFLPDGKRVLSACDDGSLRIFDLVKGDLLKTLNAHQGLIYSLAISRDGRRAVTGGYQDSQVNVWDLQTGQKVRQFDHPKLVRSVALSPDGKLAVSASTGGAIKVWDVEAGKELRTLPSAPSAWMALSPDGRRIYAVNSLAKGKAGKGVINPLNAIQVFDLHTGQEIRQLSGHTGTVRALAVSPDGRWLVSVGIDGMRVWGAK